MAFLLTAVQVVILLAACGAIVVAARSMNGARHQRRIFALALFGGLACAALGLQTVFGLVRLHAPGWAVPLGLLQGLMLPIFVILLLRSLRRSEAARLAAATAAPNNPGTSLPNRHALRRPFQQALGRSRRASAPSCVVAVAIDGFNEIEETRGPAIAQDLLRDLAFLLRDFMRSGDVPGHLRAEALGALLPATDPGTAMRMAERLGAAAQERLPHPEMDGRRMTVSFGIAPVGEGSIPAALDEAVAASELALARAQKAGGARIEVAGPLPDRSAAA